MYRDFPDQSISQTVDQFINCFPTFENFIHLSGDPFAELCIIVPAKSGTETVRTPCMTALNTAIQFKWVYPAHINLL